MHHYYNPNNRYNTNRMIQDAQRRADHPTQPSPSVIHFHGVDVNCDYDPATMEDPDHLKVTSDGEVVEYAS